jgi:hypothetical protein
MTSQGSACLLPIHDKEAIMDRNRVWANLLPMIALVLVFATSAGAAESAASASMDGIPAAADVIRMKNGSVLLGKLSGAKLGVIDFEIADIGETAIKLHEVAAIRASNADFEIDAEGRERIIGRIHPDIAAGSLMVMNANGPTVIPMSEIIRVKRIDQTLLEKLDGYVGVGYSYTTNSGVRRLSITQLVTYATESYRVFQYYSQVNTDTPGSSGTDRIDAGLGGYFDVRGTWMGLQSFMYQKIPATGVDDRWVSITGFGRRIVHNRVMDLSLLSGITLQKEHALNGDRSDVEYEIPVLLDFAVGIPKSGFDLAGLATYYESLSTSGRHRFDGRLSLDYEIVKNFKIGLQYLYNYDSTPLDPAAGTSDQSTSLTAGYTF